LKLLRLFRRSLSSKPRTIVAPASIPIWNTDIMVKITLVKGYGLIKTSPPIDIFAYSPQLDAILIPVISSDYYYTFRSFIKSLSHEELHRVLAHLVGHEASTQLDFLIRHDPSIREYLFNEDPYEDDDDFSYIMEKIKK